MPVSVIASQPTAGSLHAAYSPVILRVQATATGGAKQPPFVACDIYIKDLFYKSMIRTAPDQVNDTSTEYVFDIADALQEFLQPDIAVLDNSELLQAPHMSAKVFCKFRASGIDAEGFTIEEGVVPVQATKYTVPVPGDGLASNTFFVINAALQHEDNQDLATHLAAYKTGTWANNAFPLTHRKRYFFCDNSSDHYPLIFSGGCVDTELVLHYRLKGQSNFQNVTLSEDSPCDPMPFEVSVDGNRVDVDLSQALEAGERVFVQFKYQSVLNWTDVGYFTDQNFSFKVLLAGDYFVRVVHFCSNCVSSDPEVEPFTIAVNTDRAWRGKKPICQQVVLPFPVYVVLELRDVQEEDIWYPNNVNPNQHLVRQFGQLFAKFYSDASHLVPLNLIQNDLNIPVKFRSGTTLNPAGSYQEAETLQTYQVDANGFDVLVYEMVEVSNTTTNYAGTIDTPGSSSTVATSFEPYPTDFLVGGSTGNRVDTLLEEYTISTGAPTGELKPNNPGDDDYIPPYESNGACPVGVPNTRVVYGSALEVAKVEFRINDAMPYDFIYFPTVNDTAGGGYVYLRSISKSLPVAITVKARSLASGLGNDGYITVRVTLEDASLLEFQIPDNIETTLPQTFYGVRNINISNA